MAGAQTIEIAAGKFNERYGAGSADTLILEVYDRLPNKGTTNPLAANLPLLQDIKNLPAWLNTKPDDEFKAAALHAQKLEQLFYLPPDKLYTYTYFSQRTIVREIRSTLQKLELSHINISEAAEKIEEMPDPVKTKLRALNQVKDLLGKIKPSDEKPSVIQAKVDKLMQ